MSKQYTVSFSAFLSGHTSVDCEVLPYTDISLSTLKRVSVQNLPVTNPESTRYSTARKISIGRPARFVGCCATSSSVTSSSNLAPFSSPSLHSWATLIRPGATRFLTVNQCRRYNWISNTLHSYAPPLAGHGHGMHQTQLASFGTGVTFLIRITLKSTKRSHKNNAWTR